MQICIIISNCSPFPYRVLSKVWRPLVIKPGGTKNVAQSYVALPEMQRVFMLILITEKVVMSLDYKSESNRI